MGLNRSKGNMYEWVTHTWSPIIGCPHQCEYCYVKTYRELPVQPFINQNDFPKLNGAWENDAGDIQIEKTIFVGHMCDMFGANVPQEWIDKVFKHCLSFPENTYVFQTKNPVRILEMFENKSISQMPKIMIGTTIETDRADIISKYSKAPSPLERARAFSLIQVEKFITVEPIMQFNIDTFVELLRLAGPSWINIGADSKKHNLPEPTIKEIENFVVELDIARIPIRKKSNLNRLSR